MLQEITAALTLPGLPGWTGLVFLLLLLLVALAYLLMPFSVFGVKVRLEAIETQLDEIQTELRTLALRLPEPSRRRMPVDEDWVEPPSAATRSDLDIPPPRATPPVPPPAAWPEPTRRAEPRIDWPRR